MLITDTYIKNLNSKRSNITKYTNKLNLNTKLMFINSNTNNFQKKTFLLSSHTPVGLEEFKIDNNKQTRQSIKYIKNDLVKTLLFFSSEKAFIQNTQKNNNTLRVLSKAAYHKMDDASPVTADQNRGNFYKRLSFFNIHKLSKSVNFDSKNQISNLSYNLFFNQKSINVLNQLKLPTSLK
jgi:hypothetical protein